MKKPAQPEGVATGGSAQKADVVSPAADRFNQAVRRVMQQRQRGDKYQDAKRVLEAAGLSALAWTLP